MKKPLLIGLVERIRVGNKEYLAKVDTGASRSSVDISLASEISLGPIVKKSIVRSVHGKSVRPVVKIRFEIRGRKFYSFFNVVHRKDMKYKFLIGNNILGRGFLIDPSLKSP